MAQYYREFQSGDESLFTVRDTIEGGTLSITWDATEEAIRFAGTTTTNIGAVVELDTGLASASVAEGLALIKTTTGDAGPDFGPALAIVNDSGWKCVRGGPSSATAVRIIRHEGGTNWNLRGSATASNMTSGAYNWHLFSTTDLTVVDATLEHRAWDGAIDSPPATADIATTAGLEYSQPAGQFGVAMIRLRSTRVYFLKTIAFGTDGDPAPTAPTGPTGPVGGISAEPFLLRHNPRLNKVIPVLSSPTVTDIGATCVRPRVTKGY